MKKRLDLKKAPIQASRRAEQEELLWIAEHGDVPSIDLHGLSTLAAEHELAQFIYDQHYRRMQVVRIIHGHGTGKLKAMAEQWLKNHPELIAYARPSLSARRSGALYVILRQD